MALNFTIPTRTIEVPGGDITVRGLSSQDVTALITVHADVARELFQQLVSNPNSSLSMTALLGQGLLQEAPGFCAYAIALAAGDGSPEGVEKVRSLPFPAQVEVLTALAELTFHSDEALKKTLETVARAMNGATAAIQSLQR